MQFKNCSRFPPKMTRIITGTLLLISQPILVMSLDLSVDLLSTRADWKSDAMKDHGEPFTDVFGHLCKPLYCVRCLVSHRQHYPRLPDQGDLELQLGRYQCISTLVPVSIAPTRDQYLNAPILPGMIVNIWVTMDVMWKLRACQVSNVIYRVLKKVTYSYINLFITLRV